MAVQRWNIRRANPRTAPTDHATREPNGSAMQRVLGSEGQIWHGTVHPCDRAVGLRRQQQRQCARKQLHCRPHGARPRRSYTTPTPCRGRQRRSAWDPHHGRRLNANRIQHTFFGNAKAGAVAITCIGEDRAWWDAPYLPDLGGPKIAAFKAFV